MNYRPVLLFGALALMLSAAACTKNNVAKSNTNSVTVNQNVGGQNVNGTSSDSSFSTSGNSNANTSTNEAVVAFNANGSQPNPLTVAAGTTVTFMNSDSVAHWIASDPHPVHTGLPGFDLGALAPGAVKQYTFMKVGRWGYHDHLDATNSLFLGAVIVTE